MATQSNATPLTQVLSDCLSCDLIDWAADLTVALKDLKDAARQDNRKVFLNELMELRAILHNLDQETADILEQFKPGAKNPLS